MNPLAPFIHSAATPWNRRLAAHLLRRAGFAPSESEIRTAVAAGLEETVRSLLADGEESDRVHELDALAAPLAERDDIDGLRAWWFGRMRHTRRSLLARMTLFWHNHFATSNVKVRDARLMFQQIRVLEQHALGSFRNMMRAVARDPAMIVWLDGQQNINGRPNENFARELFELFALGVGNYTERDIKEAARAFTGWHQKNRRFQYVDTYHDHHEKTVFGRSGNLDGDDVIDLTMAQPACARWIAVKLAQEFIAPAPDEALIAAIALKLTESKFDISATLEAIFLSRAMFDAANFRVRIKSPVEFVVGIARSLELKAPSRGMADAAGQMGQRLLEPPSVKGWDGHRAWLNSATMLIRLNAAARAVGGDLYAPQAMLDRYGISAANAAESLGDLTLDGELPPPLADRLRESPMRDDAALREWTRLLISSPEYQMA
ncbi:MAG: DUF1800 domain-containing protein [Phycisphaerales bacterium]|nr:DUF1800 domain-containing protein [Phycisphaerales bacterium]